MSALDVFHPLIRNWFSAAYTNPTEIQARAWPVIAAGSNTLITAPTGSGKTLTAFLWGINRFAETKPGRILYISPLKALNADIERNLREPLCKIRSAFSSAGKPFPDISIGVRSGDTTSSERRRMEKVPPDIFITTPESLHILLSSKGGRKQLYGFSTVILDEIHALAGTKRGSFLMSAVERLTGFSGEFQRIGLSATVRPLSLIADFIGGYRQTGNGKDELYEKREVIVLQSSETKQYALVVDAPEGREEAAGDDWWKVLSKNYLDIVEAHNSTLLFANSRRMVEKISRFINDEAGERKVYAHHGSLSKEIRLEVEQRLKNGELAGIAATGSLELGIDIGSVDAVALVQTPFSAAQAVQRIGRSGHRVGEISKGIFLPFHTGDLLFSAVSARSVADAAIEAVLPPVNPLDVLAQTILSMTLYEPRDIDQIYFEIKRCWSYHTLPRREYDLVVEMLTGRYADTRIRELQPRLYIDTLSNTIEAKDSVPMLLFMSGGVIPDRGYYTMRAADSKARIGELDEEFVWERSIGDAFPFGNKVWRIRRITHNDVEVLPAERSSSVIPFWRADEQNRPYPFSKRIGDFLEEAEPALDGREFKDRLMSGYFFTECAAGKLVEYLQRQRAAVGVLPGTHRIVVEHFNDPANNSGSKQTVLHTFWGGQVNRPYAFALAAAWEERFGYPLEIFANNDCILLNLPHTISMVELIDLVSPEEVPKLLRKRLESTGYFGAKFRANAQRALLLPRKNFTQRMPLWLNRLRSKKLLEAVKTSDSFPIVLETWRECLTEDFDLQNLTRLLGELRTGEIEIHEAATVSPSPFAEGIIWRQINYHMYGDDTPGGRLTTNLSDELMKGLLDAPELLPVIPDELIAELNAKLHRTAPGYVPDSPQELMQHLQERLLIPREEWDELLAAVRRGSESADYIADTFDRIITVGPTGCCIAAAENRQKLEALFTAAGSGNTGDGDYSLFQFLSSWLQFYGPMSPDRPAELLGFPENEAVKQALNECIGEEFLVRGQFSASARETGTAEICDRKNLELLLRLRRARRRPDMQVRPVRELPFFLAEFQGLTRSRGRGDISRYRETMQQLFGFSSAAALWESDILPARCSPYYPERTDGAFFESGLVWFGCGKEKTGFSFEEDLELFLSPHAAPADNAVGYSYPETAAAVYEVLLQAAGKADFSFVAAETGFPSHEITVSLWEMAWQGILRNDTFSALRKGIERKFKPPPDRGEAGRGGGKSFGTRPRRPGRSSADRWVRSLPMTGRWILVRPGSPDPFPDPLDEEEVNKDRVRQLLDRYGILFRELLQTEQPLLQWSALFRTLRLMELSGEIVTGRFFDGIQGLQFCSPKAAVILEKLADLDADPPVYWMNAADPASLCGRGIDALREVLPPRLPTTHLVYRGPELVLVSKRLGSELDFLVPPEDNCVIRCSILFEHLVTRPVLPVKLIKTEIINGITAAESEYAETLLGIGFMKDFKDLRYRKRY